MGEKGKNFCWQVSYLGWSLFSSGSGKNGEVSSLKAYNK